ncbi:MAG: YihY family inner membrane protein [SAR324 cluster bacterium]|nr:YihY family inner membrane protein [SAR324 cluster bacterium]
MTEFPRILNHFRLSSKTLNKFLVTHTFTYKKSVTIYRFFRILIQNIWKKRLLETAQSLTFVSLLSLVPIFAIFFSVIGAISNHPQSKIEIKTYIANHFIPQYGDVIFKYLEQVANTSKATGTFGLSTFMLLGLLFYNRIDKVINDMWEVDDKRKWNENIMIFLMIIILGPLGIFISVSFTTFIQKMPIFESMSNGFFIYATSFIIPVLSSGILLFLMYAFIPIVFVRKGAALMGAIFSSSMIQLCYLSLNVYFIEIFGYQKLYGSLAVIPILILWIYIVWLVILLGALITYIWQTYRANDFREHLVLDNQESLAISATRIYLFICHRYYQQSQLASIETMQEVISLSDQRLRYILQQMKQANLVVEYSPASNHNHSVAYHPGKPPSDVACDVFFSIFQPRRRWFNISEPTYMIIEPLHSLEQDFFSTFTFEEAIKHPHQVLARLLSIIGRLRQDYDVHTNKGDELFS